MFVSLKRLQRHGIARERVIHCLRVSTSFSDEGWLERGSFIVCASEQASETRDS